MRILYDVKLRRKILTFTTITLVVSLAFLIFVLGKSKNSAQTAANPDKSAATSPKPSVHEDKGSDQTPSPKASSEDTGIGSLPKAVSTIAPAQLADPGLAAPSPSSELNPTPGYTPTPFSATPEPTSTLVPSPTSPKPTPTVTRKPTPTATPKAQPTFTHKAAPTPTPTKKPSTPAPQNTPVVNSPAKSSGKLTLQYMSGNSQNTTDSIAPRFKLTNESNSAIALSDVKIRYYYTIDTDEPQSFWCDWSTAGSSNVTGKFKKMSTPGKNADYYLEIGFSSSAGEIKPGESVEVHTRFSKQNSKNYNQSNDHSYKPTNSYTSWNKVVLIVSQNLVYGTEPEK